METSLRTRLRRYADKHPSADAELAVAVLFWALSMGRVIAAVVRHETFGTEATLSLFVVLGLPLLALGVRSHRSRRPKNLPRV